MRVVVHGDCDAYCMDRGWTIVRRYRWPLSQYDWPEPVIVTGAQMGKESYYRAKFKLMKRGYTLLSSLYDDDGFAEYQYQQRKSKPHIKSGGRICFGFTRTEAGEVVDPETMAVVQRIYKLRSEGKKYREIRDDEKVCYPDGRTISISSIQVILTNKERYKDYV